MNKIKKINKYIYNKLKNKKYKKKSKNNFLKKGWLGVVAVIQGWDIEEEELEDQGLVLEDIDGEERVITDKIKKDLLFELNRLKKIK